MARQRVSAKRNRRQRDHLERQATAMRMPLPAEVLLPLQLAIELAGPTPGPAAPGSARPTWRDASDDTAGRTVIELDLS